MLPALISQLVVILKDTALGFIIAYTELVRTSQFIGQLFDNPLQVYLVAAVIFIVVNMALSWFATYLERRLSQRTRRPAELMEMPTDAVTGA
jgi:glutamate transport system permease protein